jgi:hypothetical protein
MTAKEYFAIYYDHLHTGMSGREAYIAAEHEHKQKTGHRRYNNYATFRTMLSQHNKRRLSLKKL